MAITTAAFKPSVNGLAPHPQLQGLALFVQFVPIYPVPRPRQNRRPFFVCQLPSVPKNAISLNHRYLNVFTNSCGEPFFLTARRCLARQSADVIVRRSVLLCVLHIFGTVYDAPPDPCYYRASVPAARRNQGFTFRRSAHQC